MLQNKTPQAQSGRTDTGDGEPAPRVREVEPVVQPRNCTGKVLIVLGGRPEDWNGRCDRVDIAAQLYHPYAIKFENKPVLVCRGLKVDLQ